MLAALGVLLVVGCAAVGAEVATRVDHRLGYLAVAAYVPQGSLISPSNVAVVDVGLSDGVQAIPQGDLPTVLGRRASEALDPGSLLVPADLTTVVPLPASAALVGASLSSDQAPTGLGPGDVVIVVLSGSGTNLPTGAGGATAPASASGSGSGSAGGGDTGATPAGVLAVGTVYAVALPSASDSAASASDETLTLEVPKADAAAVTAASAAGDVSLAEISTRAGL